MVESLYLVPDWFFEIDIFLGLLFFIITGIAALYSLKLYNITKEREFKLFGISFSLLALSYLLRLYLNVFLSKVLEESGHVLRIVDIDLISKAFIYSYVLLFVIAYMTLAYMTLKVKSPQIYTLILAITMLAIGISFNKSLTVYLVASLFLTVIVYNYANRIKSGKKCPCILIAMTLLLFSNIGFIFITDYFFYQGYIISSVIELFAYGLIAKTLYKVIKDGQKKK